MTATTTYTFEFYKVDNRIKDNKQKLVYKTDVELDPSEVDFMIEGLYESFPSKKGFMIFANKTFVEKTNMMTGEKFLERYDTPYYCSPSSETYWSM